MSSPATITIEPPLVWSDGLGPRSRAGHLILRRAEALYVFAGKSIPGVVAIVGRDYKKNGKWSRTTFRLQLAAGVAVAFSGRSGWETGTIMESLQGDSWQELAAALGVADRPEFRTFVRGWRPDDASDLDAREAALAALAALSPE